MKPPIKPKVKNPWDTKNIDGIFLGEEIKQTPDHRDGSFNIALLNKLHFDNFTYNEDSYLTKNKGSDLNKIKIV